MEAIAVDVDLRDVGGRDHSGASDAEDTSLERRIEETIDASRGGAHSFSFASGIAHSVCARLVVASQGRPDLGLAQEASCSRDHGFYRSSRTRTLSF